jgi:cytochrome c peroxidase
MKSITRWTLYGVLAIALLCLSCSEESPEENSTLPSQRDAFAALGWSDAEVATLRSLWIGSLPPLPPDPSNAFADDPKAAALGEKLFFDARFSANGEVSCATCHQPEQFFTDGRGRSRGIKTTKRGAPTIVGIAYSPWLFWDGRRDSQWAQALSPLESEREHGGTRTQYARILYEDPAYRADYEAVFGPMPDLSDRKRFPEAAAPIDNAEAEEAWDAMAETDRKSVTRVFVNMGKALAAYQRRIMPGPARFDAYVKALLAGDKAAMQSVLNDNEVAGLRLFIGKATCISCHNGPLFTNNGFHNVSTPLAKGSRKDWGRFRGVKQALQSEFNCLGEYSDAGEDDCGELRFAKADGAELMAAFKVPTLRNVADTAPYMHAGQFATLDQVLDHYNRAPKPVLGHSMLAPLNLTVDELADLEAFLKTLSGPPTWEKQ